MAMSVRLAAKEDQPAILALLRSAQEDAVPEGERGERGFISGSWDEEALAAFASGPGIFVAEDKDELAGVVLTSEPELEESTGPVHRTLQMTRSLDGPVLLCGPIVVAPKFRGKGIVRPMLSALALMLGERYPTAALFVDSTNERALKVHRGLGMRKHGKFRLDDRAYTIFTFKPKDFIPKPVKAK